MDSTSKRFHLKNIPPEADDISEPASHDKDERTTMDSTRLRLVETARNSIAALATAPPTQSKNRTGTDEVELMKLRLSQTAMEKIFALCFDQN